MRVSVRASTGLRLLLVTWLRQRLVLVDCKEALSFRTVAGTGLAHCPLAPGNLDSEPPSRVIRVPLAHLQSVCPPPVPAPQAFSMSQWDAFKKQAQGMATAVASRAAAEASKVAAGATKLTNQAVSQASSVAQRAMSSNPALQLIGQEVNIGGKQLYIESLLAEGARPDSAQACMRTTQGCLIEVQADLPSCTWRRRQSLEETSAAPSQKSSC